MPVSAWCRLQVDVHTFKRLTAPVTGILGEWLGLGWGGDVGAVTVTVAQQPPPSDLRVEIFAAFRKSELGGGWPGLPLAAGLI